MGENTMKDVIKFIGLLAGAAVFATAVYALLAAPELFWGDAKPAHDRTAQQAGQ
jgi:NADH:ubiquinone oxidoreductase subunit 4 (subunit M)